MAELPYPLEWFVLIDIGINTQQLGTKPATFRTQPVQLIN